MSSLSEMVLVALVLGAPPGFSPTTTVPPGQVAGPVQRRVDPDQMPSPVNINVQLNISPIY